MAAADYSTTTLLRGLGLPAQKGPGGYFETLTQGSVAWSDLLIALFTPQGARVMNRGFGSNIHHQLFEPNLSTVDQPVVSHIVRDAVRRHCPHIEVLDVRVLAPSQSKQLRFVVEFSLRSDRTNTQTREVLIEKSFVSVGGIQ